MRQYFFFAILLLVPVAIAAWFLYALGRSFVAMYDDWKLGKELDQLQASSEARRRQRQLDGEQRLATGCEHDFEAHVSGLPPGVCSQCGLEREKPPGPCDHVWRLGEGAIPNSRCEKCGKTYSVTARPGDLA
jgi:hypothetical protein